MQLILIIIKMTSSLNILTLNVGMSSTLAGVSSFLDMQYIYIIFFQEVRLTNIDEDDLTKPGVAIAWARNYL